MKKSIVFHNYILSLLLSLTNTLYNMKKITGNESAMPHEDLTIGREFYESEIGLTIRQQFAMAAMHGLLSNETSVLRKPSEIATMAVVAADALINQLNK